MNYIQKKMESQNTKYYTPSIEEFYIGFECEIQSSYGYQLGIYPNILKQDTLAFQTLIDKGELETLKLSTIRVKYLDKEDIESLGWKLKSQTTNKSYSNWCVFELGKNELSIQFHRVNDNYPNRLTIRNTYLNVSILIKNKSELIKLMKQLGI